MKSTSAPRPQSRGVSLIEALVALAVMAFGILGLVGMQASLRANADVARQRSEAVRIAHEAVERWRSFTAITSPTTSQWAYDDIVIGDTTSTIDHFDDSTGTLAYTTNTSYTLRHTVAAAPAGQVKTLQTTVSWLDRGGQTNSVQLNTMIARIPPELAGSPGIPTGSGATSLPSGRNTAIPLTAVDQDNGTSNFVPPGASSGVTWVFNNASGLIVNVTTACSAAPSTCAATAALLSGYVRTALTATKPTSADSRNPPALKLPWTSGTLDVEVNTTAPTTSTVACYKQLSAAAVAYYCAVPLATTSPQTWSGRSVLTGFNIEATVAGGPTPNFYRVCRYTPASSNTTTVANVDHPLDYTAVTTSLTNQNFLIINSGAGSTVFACPTDTATAGYVNGNTLPHQPDS